MDDREQRGLAIAALCKITQKDRFWLVPSQTGNGHYRVCLDPPNQFVPQCTCPDYEEWSQPCKHVYAVRFVTQREGPPAPVKPVGPALPVTKRTCAERPTYRQNWPAYNAAQTNEKAKFQELLRDL